MKITSCLIFFRNLLSLKNPLTKFGGLPLANSTFTPVTSSHTYTGLYAQLKNTEHNLPGQLHRHYSPTNPIARFAQMKFAEKVC